MSVENSSRLYVGGLRENLTKGDIEAEFSRFGKVVDVWMAYNPPGFCFIEFESNTAAAAAVRDMQGVDFKGGRLRVEYSKGRSKTRGTSSRPSRSSRDTGYDRQPPSYYSAEPYSAAYRRSPPPVVRYAPPPPPPPRPRYDEYAAPPTAYRNGAVRERSDYYDRYATYDPYAAPPIYRSRSPVAQRRSPVEHYDKIRAYAAPPAHSDYARDYARSYGQPPPPPPPSSSYVSRRSPPPTVRPIPRY